MSAFTWSRVPLMELWQARTEAVELEVAGRNDDRGCQWMTSLRYVPREGVSKLVGYARTVTKAKREAERAAHLLQRDVPAPSPPAPTETATREASQRALHERAVALPVSREPSAPPSGVAQRGPCPACKGSGENQFDSPCFSCGGSGRRAT